ncbi:MAG TPA: hypothetical protein VKL40_03590 [Candidatus Angelobacter sp.]|nr:hypothetical protein [Candidatus Angelobacter sp.]
MAQHLKLAVCVVLAASLSCAAQNDNPRTSGAAHPNPPSASSPSRNTNPGPEQRFVLDTVKMAVALRQPDPQDRLRVLASAAEVASTVDRTLAKSLWKEGVQIESELVRAGNTPAVSMMASGQADCATAQNFIENLPQDAVLKAEQALIGAVTSCPKQLLDPVSRKLDAALENHIVAPRALMAAMEAQGPKSPWSQNHFEKMFASLPDPKENAGEAENIAAMYARMAGEVDRDAARKASLSLLNWLGKLDDTPQRTTAITITTGAMQQALGAQGFRSALESDVVANAVVRSNTGKEVSSQHASGEGTSVLEAMDNKGSDQTDRLREMPPSERARAAAAHGFAEGVGGDKAQAGKYFDMAFAAVDEAWDARGSETKAAALVQEVSEAAAHVDAVNALERAQRLRDSTAQSLAMLAVARVVASNSMGH